jgi:HEPN domain-containing protein
MDNETFDKDKIIRYWLDSSDEDFETMLAMFSTKRYTWSLFIGHLMVEKLLKAYFVQEKGELPPFIHNLLRLAEISNLVVTKEQESEFATITAFNINGRYDDYKMSFQKKCTPEFTNQWIDKLKEIRSWIKKQIK